MASTIKEAAIREWTLLEQNTINDIRLFILEYVTRDKQEELLDALAVIIKRGSVDSNELLQIMFQDVSNLFSSNILHYQLIACSYLKAILLEFSSTGRSSAVGLSWEMHNCCKMQFEKEKLKTLFILVINLLSEILNANICNDSNDICKHLLKIVEVFLNWEFLPPDLSRRHIGCFKGSSNPSLKPPPTWAQVLLNPDLVSLIIELYKRVNENLKEICVRCFVQLSSMNGYIFSDGDGKLCFLNHFLNSLLSIFEDISNRPSFANVISNLIIFFPLIFFNQIDTNTKDGFFDGMTKMTITLGRESELENNDEKEDSYRRLLDSWARLAIEDFPLSLTHCSNIFESFLHTHLSYPNGCRPNLDKKESMTKSDEDDSEKYKDELCSVATLGRVNFIHCLNLINTLLNNRFEEILNFTGNNVILLYELFEDTHWIILIATALLTDDTLGETPLIPSQVIQYSIEEKCNQKKTIDFLNCSTNDANDVDSVVRLVVNVQKVLKMCLEATRRSLNWSPQVASTSARFLQRWIRTYLLPTEENYSEMSSIFNTVWGCDAPISQTVVNRIIDCCVESISIWSGEEDPLVECIQMLVCLAERKQRALLIMESNGFWILVEQLSCLNIENLPSFAVRLLCRGIINAGTSHYENNDRWNISLTNLHTKLVIVNDSNSHKRQVSLVLELICGVIEATTTSNYEILYNFVSPVLENGSQILDRFQEESDISDILFEFYNLIANRQLCYLKSHMSKHFYHSVGCLLDTYSRINQGKIRFSCDVLEDQLQDYIWLMEILTHILSRDFVYIYSGNQEEENDSEHSNQSATLVLKGLNLIVPTISIDMLRFPRLSTCYYKLVVYFCEGNAKLILNSNLLKNIISSLQFGLTSTLGVDVVKMCLEAVSSLSSVSSNHQSHLNICQLVPLLEAILKMLLLEPFEMDLLDTAADTLFSLMISNSEAYKKLVSIIINSQENDEHKQRLARAFNELTPNQEYFLNNRKNKTRFIDKFESFVLNCRAMLCIH